MVESAWLAAGYPGLVGRWDLGADAAGPLCGMSCGPVDCGYTHSTHPAWLYVALCAALLLLLLLLLIVIIIIIIIIRRYSLV